MAEGFHHDIPILHKVYDFYKELYTSLLNFPKRHRYSLGQRLDNITIELFESLVLASRESDKLVLLKEADIELEILKLLLRLAKDTQSLDNKKYIYLESFLQEIGKMLGGWIRATKQSADKI